MNRASFTQLFADDGVSHKNYSQNLLKNYLLSIKSYLTSEFQIKKYNYLINIVDNFTQFYKKYLTIELNSQIF